MIEQAMYFALGFLVAGLFTLMFLPAFWRRATRLSMRRLQMLIPLSMEEVVAERDLLRAEFAVRERRLEQEMEAVKAGKAIDLAAIGRHAARVAELDGQFKKAEAQTRDKDQELREAQMALAGRVDLLSTTEVALHEITERAERGVERLRQVESDKEALAHESAAQQARIAELTEAAAQLRRDLVALREAHGRASAEAARTPGLTGDLDRVSRELESTRAERQTLADTLQMTRAQLSGLQEKRKNETDHLESALRAARSEAREGAEKLESARAESAALQGAVEALRSERAQERRGDGAQAFAIAGSSQSEADISALREAVIGFGDRVAQMQENETAKSHSGH